jgi:alkanesulfonate monooxygenase SsuD/methylene tetrahydromethanopterin reductase-like flavin-dependent oxidoreductase (luciferase family)
VVIAAETDDMAFDLFTSVQQIAIGSMRGRDMLLVPPDRNFLASLNAEERARLDQVLPFAIVGSRDTVRREIEALVSATEADELMILPFIYDVAARRRCVEIVADICRHLLPTETAYGKRRRFNRAQNERQASQRHRE